MPVNPDEITICQLFHSYNFLPKRFSDDELNNKKTPDFKVFMGKQLIFYCEVKSIDNSPWPEIASVYDSENSSEYFNEDPIEPTSWPDRTYNRIAKKTYDASKQFESVNNSHDIPNVLAFVNHEELSDFTDLVLTFDGYRTSQNHVIWFVKPETMESLRRHAKHLPDLFIWLNHDKTEAQFLFITRSPFYITLCNYFGKKPRISGD